MIPEIIKEITAIKSIESISVILKAAGDCLIICVINLNRISV